MRITDEEFDLMVGHLVAAAQQAGVEPDHLAGIAAVVQPFRPDVVTVHDR